MSINISWSKAWSSSDDGTYLHGADLAAIQSDIATGFNTAVSTSSNNTYAGVQTFNGAVSFTSSVTGVNPKIVVVTDQASPVFDASAGDYFTLSMASDRTMLTPTNYPASGTKRIVIRAYASGGARTLTLPVATTGDFIVGAITITQTASGKYDIIECLWNADTNRWMVVLYAKGY